MVKPRTNGVIGDGVAEHQREIGDKRAGVVVMVVDDPLPYNTQINGVLYVIQVVLHLKQWWKGEGLRCVDQVED